MIRKVWRGRRCHSAGQTWKRSPAFFEWRQRSYLQVRRELGARPKARRGLHALPRQVNLLWVLCQKRQRRLREVHLGHWGNLRRELAKKQNRRDWDIRHEHPASRKAQNIPRRLQEQLLQILRDHLHQPTADSRRFGNSPKKQRENRQNQRGKKCQGTPLLPKSQRLLGNGGLHEEVLR